MICLLLCAHHRLVSLVSPTDDVVSHIKRFQVNLFYLYWVEFLLRFQLQRAFNCRLRMDLSVVILEYRGLRPFKILSKPINFKTSSDSIHEALLTFEHFQRASDPSLCKECHKSAAGSCIWICQPLPVGKPAGASDP